VFTYRSHNPINDLIYGYGGLKLFPKKNLLAVTEFKVDMTTSIGAKFVPKFEIANSLRLQTLLHSIQIHLTHGVVDLESVLS
jgi:hypothetical protein